VVYRDGRTLDASDALGGGGGSDSGGGEKKGVCVVDLVELIHFKG
jgi:hypothetical protein